MRNSGSRSRSSSGSGSGSSSGSGSGSYSGSGSGSYSGSGSGSYSGSGSGSYSGSGSGSYSGSSPFSSSGSSSDDGRKRMFERPYIFIPDDGPYTPLKLVLKGSRSSPFSSSGSSSDDGRKWMGELRYIPDDVPTLTYTPSDFFLEYFKGRIDKGSSSGSSPFSSSGSSSDDGRKWMGELRYIPDDGPTKTYTPSELFYEICQGGIDEGFKEVFEKVDAYKTKLSAWQLTSFMLYHMFIVFETRSWYWSIEKHSDRITIQRSKNRSTVKDRFNGEQRTGTPMHMAFDNGKTFKSVNELLRELLIQLLFAYDVLMNNCQHFAKQMFNSISLTKSI